METFRNVLMQELLALSQRERNLKAYEDEVKDLKEHWQQEMNVDPQLALRREERLANARFEIQQEKEMINRRFYQLVQFGQLWNGGD